MKILLVNNRTKHLGRLKKSLRPHKVNVVWFNKFYFSSAKDFDCVILSGGKFHSVENHIDEYKKEIDFIKETRVPVFGICLGFEMIVKAFGGDLKMLKAGDKRVSQIKIISGDKIIKDVKKRFKVYESHLWKASKTKDLKVIAKEDDYPAIVKVRGKNIYGVNFHPEMMEDKTQGYKILNNFLKQIK